MTVTLISLHIFLRIWLPPFYNKCNLKLVILESEHMNLKRAKDVHQPYLCETPEARFSESKMCLNEESSNLQQRWFSSEWDKQEHTGEVEF